jgi:sugar-specific transcriptional regulator TrmB
VVRLSLKKLLETLEGFGFKQSDSKIYVFLAKKGPHTAKDLETALKMPKWQIYNSLRNLQKKGTVTAILRRPALFSALPFEKAIDLAAKARIKEAQQEQASTNQAMLYWEKMMKEYSDSTQEFQTGEEEVKNK